MNETVKFIQETNKKIFALAEKYGYKKKFNKFIEPEDRKKGQVYIRLFSRRDVIFPGCSYS